jgi:hypothetical protein
MTLECPYFEYTDGSYVRHMGKGPANMLAYLAKGFRGWQLFGFVKEEDSFIGFPLGETAIIPVYGTRNEIRLQSDDDPEKEQKQIDEGKTAILCFYGTDNCSYMRRLTPEEFDTLKLTRFSLQTTDLFYNS